MPLIILTKKSGKSVLVQTETIAYCEAIYKYDKRNFRETDEIIGTSISFNADRFVDVREKFHEIMEFPQ